jgi:phosphatidylserine decarboxylase
VHSQRAPVDGTVREIQYSKGLFVNAALDKASSDNERNALILAMDDGTEISCVQVAGLIARRILCYVNAGERLARGQRYGFIRFGSRVDVYLPAGSTPRVAIGDKIKASSTVLAELPRR